jgi:hypothetical protein
MTSAKRPLRNYSSLLVAAAAASILCAAGPAAAQAPAPTTSPVPAAPAAAPAAAPPAPKWYEEIAVNGFLSATYSYNFNTPASGTNQYRAFDFDDNTIKLDVVTLTIQKAISKPGEVGFRIDASAGSSLPRVEAAYGLFQGQDFDLKQGYVSYIAPLGSGLRFDAGKFLTYFGYEYVESWDTPNDNATRSFGFFYGVPVTHTGLKATYSFSDQLTGLVMVTNGWDNARDNNSSKSIGAELIWTPTKTVSIAGNFITGPERTAVNSDPRSTYEIVAQWKLTDSTVFGLDGLYGTEKGAVTPGETASWSGLAGYARLGVTDAFALCLRAEIFNDADGARTGTVQKLKEVTLTPELKIGKGLCLRADLRIDWSDQSVFEKSEGQAPSKSQPTVAINAYYAF